MLDHRRWAPPPGIAERDPTGYAASSSTLMLLMGLSTGSLANAGGQTPCCCQTVQPHATVNTSSFQGRATPQGRWTKQFSLRRPEKASTTSGGVPKRRRCTGWYKNTSRLLVQVELEVGAGLPDFVREGFD